MIEVNQHNAAEVADLAAKLLAPFPPEQVKYRPTNIKQGRCLALAYIDSRAVMDRLDAVVGIDGWRDEYTVLPSGEVECRLSLRLAGNWVTKADVGGQSEQPDDGDKMKAAYSDALKRAAVKFGIGRFLYRLPQQWVDYDPVRKCIVNRPTPAAAPVPQPAPKSSPNLAPVADNPGRRAAWAQKFAQCKTHADFDTLACRVAEDKLLSDADRKALRPVAVETRERLKATPATA